MVSRVHRNCSITQIMAGSWRRAVGWGCRMLWHVAGILHDNHRLHVAATGQYTLALVIASVVALVGAFAWVVLMPAVVPVPWGAERAV